MKRILILALLFVIACQQGNQQGQVAEAFRTGSEGVRTNFVATAPPDKIFDTESFFAAIDVENLGAFNIGAPGDRVYLSGFDPRIITGIPAGGIQIPLLEGKNQFNPRGSQTQLTFTGGITRITGDFVPQPIQATTCYKYQTQATTTTCIDPDPRSTGVRPKVCTPTNVALGTQAAPVAVSTIEVQPQPGKTTFRIIVNNAGNGEAFRNTPQTMSKCDPQQKLAFDEIGYVEVTDVKVGGTSIKPSCRPLDRQHIRLDSTSKTGQFVCDFTTGPGTAPFVSPITVTLTYGYRNTIQKQVTIVKTDVN
ncbi:hypothetical protein HY486_02890 [Candidatus Woesearchaeota archaeon]|nr:hypothetical protein [Candidatus Woesearchaeota archaeon]